MSYLALKDWPNVSRDVEDIDKLYGKSTIGLDLEWDSSGKPNILGLSDGELHVSVPYKDGRDRFLNLLKNYPNTTLVGHNIVGADLFVLEQVGVSLPLSQIEDTIIRHWLVNMHLSKMSQKGALEEDADEKRGRGFNNLWTMASLYTNFPHWKDCRDGAKVKNGKIPPPIKCVGPCPTHDEYGYNGLDSAAPVIALPNLVRTMKLRNLEKLYPMHRELAWRLAKIREFGVRIDVPYVAQLREEFDRDKLVLAQTLPFNPDSEKQVREYFKSKDIILENNQEVTIRAMVEELEDDAPDELITLQDYKELGNGPDRWFKPMYKDKHGYVKGFMDERGYVHPHIAFFTSTARMMCSSPNFQNVAKRRQSRKVCECGKLKLDPIHNSTNGHKFKGESIGKKIRRAIIAPDGYYIVRADYSNAEGRTVLYLSGYEAPTVDMHSWMRDNIGLREDEPFSIALGGAREAAKSVTHACLTGEHEVLTPNGWVKMEEYLQKGGSHIAQWEDDKISFVAPDKFHEFSINEEVDFIKGTGFSTIATKNHEFPFETQGTWRGQEEIKKYRYLRKLPFIKAPKASRIPVNGIFEQNNLSPFSDLEIQQAIAIQADATERGGDKYEFHLVKTRKQKRLEQLFDVKGKPCKCHQGGLRYHVRLNSTLLGRHKTFTYDFLKISNRQRELFLSEILLWDGTQSNDSRNAKYYFNTDYNSITIAQTIAHLSGRQALIRQGMGSGFPCKNGCKDSWILSFNKRKYAWTEKLTHEEKRFQGEVYCFTVPSQYFLVRHNGVISVTGNSNYLEGLQLKSENELRNNPRLKKEIELGARLVYWDWKFRGKIVTLTGVNLSRRAFGEASLDNRAKANQVVSRYIDKAFPEIRTWQKRVTKQIEEEGVVRPPHGYVLLSYGNSSEDQIKTAVATYGQQPTAHISKLAILDLMNKLDQGSQIRPILQVHDEILTYVPESISPSESKSKLLASMQRETPEMPGFVIPADPTSGPNWRDQVK